MKRLIFLLAVFSLLLTACGGANVPAQDSGKLNVVATTSIVADVVANVGGDNIDLAILLPVGTDPHSFEPTPQDIAKVADADIVIANGAGLEEFLQNLLESANATDKIVEVSHGIELLESAGHDDHDHEEGEEHEEGEDHDHEEGEEHEDGEDHDHEDGEEHEDGEDHDHEEGEEHEEGEDHDHEEGEEHEDGEDHDHEEGDDHDHAGGDPHTWVDPNNVMVWVENIEAALSEADPANTESYAANAAAYAAELEEVDAWIREQIATIPEENRKIVTDHQLLGYYIEEYGLEMAGAIIPGYSSLSQPSAQELAAIEDAIHDLDVKAVFVGNTVNPNLAERVAEDTGVELVFFYTGSLSAADGDAPTYLDYLRYNTTVFVEALK